MTCSKCKQHLMAGMKFCPKCGTAVTAPNDPLTPMAEDAARFEPVFGTWRFNRFIGAGSFGRVYEIERKEYSQTYKAALKIVTVPKNRSDVESALSEGMTRESAEAYFYSAVEGIAKEFAVMAKLRGNSNIVSYEDHKVVRHESDIGWDILIRMELLQSMNEYLGQKPITESEAVKVGVDLCQALVTCQKHSIIHRDIKPGNVFVSEAGNYKLGDFGVARTLEGSSGASTRTGTNAYMAPEVYWGEHYDSTVDEYSLGLVLYWLLNGRRLPFFPPAPEPITPTARDSALTRRLKGEALPRPTCASEPIWKIIRKACAFEPEKRYRTAEEMLEQLKAIPCETRSAEAAGPSHKKIEQENEVKQVSNGGAASMPKQAEMDGEGRKGGSAPNGGRAYPQVEDFAHASSATRPAPVGDVKAYHGNGRWLAIPLAVAMMFAVVAGALLIHNSRNMAPTNDATVSIDEQEASMTDADKNMTEAMPYQIDRARDDYYFYDVYSDNTVSVTLRGCKTKDIIIPATYNGMPVVTVRGKTSGLLFQEGTTITIPEGVTTIAPFAFSDQPNLVGASLPNSLKRIEYGAFERCANLDDVDIPESVEYIGANAFDETPWYEALTEEYCVVGDGVLIKYNGEGEEAILPNTVKHISDVFAYSLSFDSSALTRVKIPNTVVSIDESAFMCSGIQSINIPNSVTEIGEDAFQDCGRLTDVFLPASIQHIGKSAFASTAWVDERTDVDFLTAANGTILIAYLGSDENVVIPEGITQISDFATTNNAEQIKTITLPEGVTRIENSVQLPNLEQINIPDTVVYIGDYAFRGSGIKQLHIPGSVEYLGTGAFESCEQLESVSIDEGVKAVRLWNFYGCHKLKSVQLPEGLRSLDNQAFEECSLLEELIVPDGTEIVK